MKDQLLEFINRELAALNDQFVAAVYTYHIDPDKFMSKVEDLTKPARMQCQSSITDAHNNF